MKKIMLPLVALSLAFLLGCEGQAEFEGTYECTGEEVEEPEGEEPEEPRETSDTIIIQQASETTLTIDSEQFGEMLAEITGPSTFSIDQELEVNVLGIGGGATMRSSGQVSGDQLVLTGEYEVAGVATVTFSLSGAKN